MRVSRRRKREKENIDPGQTLMLSGTRRDVFFGGVRGLVVRREWGHLLLFFESNMYERGMGLRRMYCMNV